MIPRWIVKVAESNFTRVNYAGNLPQVTLAKVVAAVDEVLSEWPHPELPPFDLL